MSLILEALKKSEKSRHDAANSVLPLIVTPRRGRKRSGNSLPLVPIGIIVVALVVIALLMTFQDEEETEVDTFADVTIVKSGEPDLVATGDTLVYTLVYTNNGPDPAQNVVVSDTLIPQVEYVEASPVPRPPTGRSSAAPAGRALRRH